MIAKGILYDSFVVSLAASLLSLDRTAAFQTMVSRPIVAAPLIGWCLGDMETGLAAGVFTELLCMSDLPLGGHVPAHETALAAATVAAAVFISRESPGVYVGMWDKGMALVPIAVLVAIPVSLFMRWIDMRARRINVRFFKNAESAVERGDTGQVARENMKGLLSFFALTFAGFFAVVLSIGWAAGHLAAFSSMGKGMGGYLSYMALLAVSTAYALSGFNAKGCGYAFWGAALLSAALLAIGLR